jgi:hypothetical protein
VALLTHKPLRTIGVGSLLGMNLRSIMGRRMRWRCMCHLCTGEVRRKLIERDDARLAALELAPEEDEIFDSWFDWDAYYDT